MNINTSKPYLEDDIQVLKKIAKFWNKVSYGWKNIWGDHIHHGFYDEQAKYFDNKKVAEEILIDKILMQLKVRPKLKILDVGCGIGGTSIYLSKQIQAEVTGISISHEQVKLAKEQALKDNTLQTAIKNKITLAPQFLVDDAHHLRSMNDNEFDVVWSLESAEQFYNKYEFIKQAYRVLKPGGQIMIATWCSDKEQYTGDEAKLYQKLCQAFLVPYMPTINYYQNSLLQKFDRVKVFDWSENVKSSWARGITEVKKYSLLQLLRLGGLQAGLEGMIFIRNLKLMDRAFTSGQLRYGVLVGTKNS